MLTWAWVSTVGLTGGWGWTSGLGRCAKGFVNFLVVEYLMSVAAILKVCLVSLFLLVHGPQALARPVSVVPDPVHFKYGGGELAGPEEQFSINQCIALMAEDRRRVVILVGFADPSGAKGANVELSLARAELVKAALVAGGVAPERIYTRGLGEAQVGPSSADLRRVDFVFQDLGVFGKQPDVDAVVTGLLGQPQAKRTGAVATTGTAKSQEGKILPDSGHTSSTEKSVDAKSAEQAENIEKTGIKEIDSLFSKVQGLLNSVRSARTGIRGAEQRLNEVMGLPAEASLSSSLSALKAESKGNIGIKLENGRPRLSAKTGAGPRVGPGVNAVNGLVKALVEATQRLAAVPKQAQAIVAEAKSLPSRLPEIAKSAGLGLKDVPPLLKAVKKNIKLTASVPKECAAVGKQAASTFKAISGAFTG